ncbi:MAG: ABC transporter ATP-binding protein [Lachnospiraceae bacterium]|nr:ABC transporter ATP-binding protein [Lachnospiraceae bacterium]
MEVLRAEHVTKKYDGRTIIEDISLHLDKGELISLLGLSGSGKTTLFHVLSGLTVPEKGRVLFCGEDITGRPGKISYMLQKDLLLEHKKVIDNAALPLVLSGMPKKKARETASEFFQEFGLEGTQMKYPSQLSGGMRQRAALLRTYLSSVRTAWDGPDSRNTEGAALLDEPFSALDTITRGQIHTWYLEVMEKIKLSTLLITHDIDEAILLSDRVCIMTGSPGVIRDEIRILPSRKERQNFDLTQEFLAYKKQILEILARQ